MAMFMNSIKRLSRSFLWILPCVKKDKQNNPIVLYPIKYPIVFGKCVSPDIFILHFKRAYFRKSAKQFEKVIRFLDESAFNLFTPFNLKIFYYSVELLLSTLRPKNFHLNFFITF